MLGSAVTAGRLTLEYAHNLTDADGATVKGELVRIGFDGDAHETRPVPHAYIECHIEQGPLLADAGVDVGIVTGVQAISWQRLAVDGAAAHAGTTPIESRHDAGLVAPRWSWRSGACATAAASGSCAARSETSRCSRRRRTSSRSRPS
jgi:N-carbamoyl-L-amino-acid hydrolase